MFIFILNLFQDTYPFFDLPVFSSLFLPHDDSLFVCFCMKKIVRKRKGKATDKVSGQLFRIFSQAEEGQVWELF